MFDNQKKLIENFDIENKKLLEQIEILKEQDKREHIKMSDKIFQTNKEVNKKISDVYLTSLIVICVI